MKLKTLINKLEQKYPKSLAYDWDNVGLLVGDEQAEVKKVLLALEANEKVIDEAINTNCDLIITHHPFLFRKMNKIVTSDLKGRLVHKLIKNDISLYSMHTNFDIAFDGLNDYFVNLLKLSNVKILDKTVSENLYKIVVYVPKDHGDKVRAAMSSAGAGHIGNYSDCTFNSHGIGTFKPLENTNPYIGTQGELEEVEEVKIETIVSQNLINKVINDMIKAHPYEEVAYDIYKLENKGDAFGLGRVGKLENTISLKELCDILKDRLDMNYIRFVGDINSNINKVAIVTGSGADMLKKAKSVNCDVLITGDVKYHDAQDALDMDINVVDCGHFDSEKVFVDILDKFLYNMEEIEVAKSSVDLNPFNII